MLFFQRLQYLNSIPSSNKTNASMQQQIHIYEYPFFYIPLCSQFFIINRSNIMKQKSQVFRNKIRKNQLQQLFSQKRKALKQHPFQQTKTIIISNTPTSTQISIETTEAPSNSQTATDYQQQWRENQYNIEKYLTVGSFQLMVNIFQDIYHSFKKIHCNKSMSNANKNQLMENFLRLNILSYVVRAVLEAHLRKLSPGLLQVLTHSALKILIKVIHQHAKQFTQSLFLQSDLLKFLAACLAEPKFDKKHIQLVMNAIVHMIIMSRAATNKLFQILNSRQRGQFNLSAIFYNISNMQIQPSQTITQNFIIMMKYYFIAIDQLQSLNKIKNTCYNTAICLNSHQMDICFEITIKSLDFYMKAPKQIEQTLKCLDECIQLLKYLIQQSEITSKWLDRINYKKILQLLLIEDISHDIKVNILISFDHLIFIDANERFTEYLVKQCELVSCLWGIKNGYFGYVMNILANLASVELYKPQLSVYCHQIFLNLQYQPSYILYQFIYNWFNAQDFEIRESKDQLAIKLLESSQEIKPETTALQSMIWLRLAQSNQMRIPTRILELDNQCSKLLNNMLRDGNQFEEEV